MRWKKIKKEFNEYLLVLKPNLRDNQFASLITLKYVSEFIKKVESDIEGFSYKYNFQLDKLNSILENYKIILTYHK